MKYNERVEGIKVRVPKGEKEKIRQHAKCNEESMNEFICRAIHETIENDNLDRGITRNHLKEMKRVEMTERTCVSYINEDTLKEYIAIVNPDDHNDVYFICQVVS